MKNNINTPKKIINNPLNIPLQRLNISTQNIHHLTYTGKFHWGEESTTSALLASIYGDEYGIDGFCTQCGTHLKKCQNGYKSPLKISGRIASFNKKQESRYSGSDFLLSFKDGKQKITFNFQAKSIALNKNMDKAAWDKIFYIYKKNSGFHQYNTLLKYSRKHGFEPFYIFYTEKNNPHLTCDTKCKIAGHNGPHDTFSLVIPAQTLRNIYNNWSTQSSVNGTFMDIVAKESIPLPCLFKHHFSQKNLVNSLHKNIKLFFPEMETRVHSIGNSDYPGTIIDEEVPHLQIEQPLIHAAKTKIETFSKVEQQEIKQISNREFVSLILETLNYNEFTTFQDIAKTINHFIGGDIKANAVSKIIKSKYIYANKAVKVVSQKQLNVGHSVDVSGNFDSHFGYNNREEVLKEFYPEIEVLNNHVSIDGETGVKYIADDALIANVNRLMKVSIEENGERLPL